MQPTQKTTLLLTFSALIGLMGLTGCPQGGNQTRIPGRQCIKSHSPINMNIPQESKIVLGSTLMHVGEYELSKADLFFVGDDGFRIHIEEERKTDGTFTKTVYCAKNTKLTNQSIFLAVPGISHYSVREFGKSLVDVRIFGFSSVNSVTKITSDNTNTKLESATKVFEETATESFMVDLKESSFEIRTNGRQGEGAYYLSLKFKKVILPLVTDIKNPEGNGY